MEIRGFIKTELNAAGFRFPDHARKLGHRTADQDTDKRGDGYGNSDQLNLSITRTQWCLAGIKFTSHITADSQKSADVDDFTKFKKSLLITEQPKKIYSEKVKNYVI